MNFYNKDLNEIFKEFDSSRNGMDQDKIQGRILEYGKNEIKEAKGKSPFKRFISQFNEPMIIILIIVAIIMFVYGYLFSHEYTDTIVITIVVLLNAIMSFIQEQKAEVTLSSLKNYSTSTCKIRRNGKIVIVDSILIVPGDIILLEAGDKIPADARIISESNLSVDESPLTGESIPVKKTNKMLNGSLLIQEQSNMLFSGCNIINGTVEAIVVKTGMDTEIGSIAKSLNTPYEVSTPLQIKMNEISKKITILVFIIIIFIFFYGVLNNYKLIEIIMLCVSLAVAAIPEGLPAVITIALSTGSNALAKKKTIVRQMSAVETLGSTDIICSDKTGTITQNKMQIKEEYILNKKMANYIMSLANETITSNNKLIGDPTETCMYDYLKNNNINPIYIKEKYQRINFAPFDSERKLMSSVNNIDNKTYILVKGSIENLLEKCKYIEDKITKELSASLIFDIKQKEKEMADNALRVIGFAYKELKNIPTNSIETLNEENNLIFVGMIGIIDPPRVDIKESVQKCKNAHIRPVMITGDSLNTACAIAKEIGIINNNNEGTIGSELDKYNDFELQEIVKKYSVYARVSPIHKSRIVAAWQANGKVVAMTGDGVNDAPAIKDAHVGIGMGITGTDVTKSVADIILLDDSFSTIVDAVEEGRRIFTNIRNNVVYSLSSNFAELFTVLIGIFTGHTILLPIHILFIDLITDTVPSICLSFEKSEKNIMNQKPRGIDKPIFTHFVISSIIFSALIETIFALITYFVSLKFFNSDIARSLALLTVVIQELLYAVSCRNIKETICKQGIFSNKCMNIGLIVVAFVEILFFLTPIGKFINIVEIKLLPLLIVLCFNMSGLLLYEIGKPFLKRLFKD